jgi:penicillin amidase
VLAGTVLLLAIGLVLTFVRRPLPERDGEVQLPGLKAEVTVFRDEQAVPQVYADDPVDLFRVQGYLHAQDRFFQMDLRRHITAGRVSELVGDDPDALQADAVVRTLGWRRVAEQELPLLSASTRRWLEAYSQGVNDYLRGRSASELSVSYTVLARANPLGRIEPWTPLDSLSWLKAMAWDLRGNYDEELQRARAISTVRDLDRVAQLFPTYPYAEHSPILAGAGRTASTSSDTAASGGSAGSAAGTGGGSAASRAVLRGPTRAALLSDAGQQALQAADRALGAAPELLGRPGARGSNSWVVGGDLTAGGLPLLANDPHLGAGMPGVWSQVGLHCNQITKDCPFDVAGFGFAGVPGVVIGHNARISWGLTNLNPDVTDFYLERISDAGALHDGKRVPLTTRTETIAVAGGESKTITVRATSHGPVISDVLTEVAKAGQTAPVTGEKGDREPGYAVSLAWTGLTPGRSMDALLGLDVAGDFAAFRSAALKLDAPAQNVIYADVDGHIGYQAPGRIPRRGPGSGSGSEKSGIPADGTWPHPGWDSSFDWKGEVPRSELPWVEDPAEGFIVAANQAVTGPGGGVRLTTDWDYGYRSQRIRDLLTRSIERKQRFTLQQMRAIQSDTRNGIAPTLVPWLLKTEVGDSFTREAVDLLKGWDFSQPTDSAAAAYFNVVWATILDLTFSDELPEGFRPDGGDRWFEVVRTLLDTRRDPWWDDRRTPDVVESRDEVLRRALEQARLTLTATLGKDPSRWQWGRLHRLRLEQAPLGGTASPGLLRRLVNRGPYPAPGGSALVDAFAWDAASGSYDVVAAPSMRMVVDLSDLDASRWVNQTGVSGHPVDDHYDDQLQAWLEGRDYPWPAGRKAIEAAAEDHQLFTPGSG